jgi:TolB-like protein/Tfp pilus assembly protein PilF
MIMEDKEISGQISQILKKSRREPAKLMELIACIRELNEEGKAASYPGIVRRMWPEEWKQARDKVKFEKTKWDLLCKRRREINTRIFSSNLCFNFYIELSQEKHFKIQTSPEDIRIHRHKELEWNLARERSKSRKEKIVEEIVELNNKFRDFEKEDSGEGESEGAPVKSGILSVASVAEGKGTDRKVWIAFALLTISVFIALGVTLKRVYFRSNLQTSELNPTQSSTIVSPGKPSIAVLPFVNMSEDKSAEYFGDGLTEDIISALSKVPRLFVIARNSSFSYKGKRVKVQQVGEELGVRYVLEGSFHKAGDRVRITAQLIDALTGYHLWSERYDGEIRDIFALQDEITKKVLTALQVKLTQGETARILAKSTNNLEAYLKFVQAWQLTTNPTREGTVRARQLLEEAITLDPKYSDAYRHLALTYWYEVIFGLSKSPRDSMQNAMKMAQKAIALDESNAAAYSTLGIILGVKGQYDKAIAAGKRAYELEPNSTAVLVHYARVLNWVGRTQEALQLLEEVMRMEPIPAIVNLIIYAESLRDAGRYDEAINVAKRAIEQEPDATGARVLLTQCYWLSGHKEEARAEAGEVIRMHPKFSIEMWQRVNPAQDKAKLKIFVDAMREAGLPE